MGQIFEVNRDKRRAFPYTHQRTEFLLRFLPLPLCWCFGYDREARRKESRERPPRTTGALYRRVLTSKAGTSSDADADANAEFVNVDMAEGSVDPLQVPGIAPQEVLCCPGILRLNTIYWIL